MAETEIVTVRVPKHVADKLKALAKATNRPKNYHAAKAVEAYTTHETKLRELIEEGIWSAENEPLIPHEEVMTHMRNYIAKLDHNEAAH